jgi:hypothetical protein
MVFVEGTGIGKNGGVMIKKVRVTWGQSFSNGEVQSWIIYKTGTGPSIQLGVLKFTVESETYYQDIDLEFYAGMTTSYVISVQAVGVNGVLSEAVPIGSISYSLLPPSNPLPGSVSFV